MKKVFLTIAAAVMAFTLSAQQPEAPKAEGPYQFTDVIDVKATSVKDQSSSGTCWSFAGLAFIESELIEAGKGEYDLSEMWIVRYTYVEKAIKYARMHGKIEFSAGGATHDVFDVIKKYGIVPEEVYAGLQYGTEKHRHGELDATLKGYMDAIIKNPNRTLSVSWMAGVNGILDAYLGAAPEEFTYNGNQYTPMSFYQSLGIDVDDYVSFTSYTHHPFHTEVILEIPDNWAWGTSYNIPMEEMMQIIDTALEKGHTVNWGSDVSEQGFQYAKGFAVIPNTKVESMADSERAKWEKMNARERMSVVATATEPVAEMEITQEDRQIAFDNYETTDDHGMLITGIAKDQNGNKFYKVKNSWDTNQVYGGYFYASEPFVAYKTMNITVNKSVLSKDMKKKLGIK